MRKIFLLLMMGLTIAVIAMGCTKKSTKGESGMTGEGTPATTTTQTVTEEPQKMARMGQEDITGKYMEDMGTSAKFKDIYFDYDQYNIKDESKSTLRELATYLSQNDAKVMVEGHCDERGTNEYNLALGDRRANSTKQYLVASGVSAGKIETISYGEEKPQCEEKTEGCWSKNRRAHFVVLLPK